jgi:hypothetical protein
MEHYMNTAGLHHLRFHPKEPPMLDIDGMIHEAYINSIVKRLFGLTLSNFVHLNDRTAHKRKYRNAYSFNEQILVFANDYTKRKSISIEINGSGFDHACINVEKVCSLVQSDFVVTAIHAKIDTTETPFKHLFKCYQHDAITSNTVKGSDRQSRTRTLIFGAPPKKYEIYEAGLYHEHIKDPNLCRHELKLETEAARQFFEEWRKEPQSLEQLIKSYITGQFGVRFKRVSEDSNVGRRPALPMWTAWIGTATPRKFDRVTPSKPQVANQQKTLEARLLKTRLEIGEQAYHDALANVEMAYYLNRHPEEKSPEQQLALDLPESVTPTVAFETDALAEW